jgi:hypothetical protein
MEHVVTPITQIYIANQTLNDFLFVLPLLLEGDLLRVIKFICPHKVTMLAVRLLQCISQARLCPSNLRVKKFLSFLPFVMQCVLHFSKISFTPVEQLRSCSSVDRLACDPYRGNKWLFQTGKASEASSLPSSRSSCFLTCPGNMLS